MTVAATLTQRQYTGTGTSAQFSFPNKVFSASDLVITIYDTSGGVYPFVNFANAALGWTYSVQNVDVDTGCIVVLSNVLTSGWVLDIRSLIPELQSTSVKNQGQFLPELHEEAFDRATRMIQDLLRLTYTFGIHGPDTEFTSWPALPTAALRKGYALMFDGITGLPGLGFLSAQNVTTGLLVPLLGLQQTAAESAAAVVPTNLIYQPLNVLRYMSASQLADYFAGTALVDQSSAFVAAEKVAFLGGAGKIYAPAGIYLISAANLTLRSGVTLSGDGSGGSEYFPGSAFNTVQTTQLWRKSTGTTGPILIVQTADQLKGLYIRDDLVGGSTTGTIQIGTATHVTPFVDGVFNSEFEDISLYGPAISGTLVDGNCTAIYFYDGSVANGVQRYFNRFRGVRIQNYFRGIRLGENCNANNFGNIIFRQVYIHFDMNGGAGNSCVENVIAGSIHQSIGPLPSVAITFTAGLGATVTSGTLTANWTLQTGVYGVLFSQGDIRLVTLTTGATSAAWTLGLTSAATTSAAAAQCIVFVLQNGAVNNTFGGYSTECNGAAFYLDASSVAGNQFMGHENEPNLSVVPSVAPGVQGAFHSLWAQPASRSQYASLILPNVSAPQNYTVGQGNKLSFWQLVTGTLPQLNSSVTTLVAADASSKSIVQFPSSQYTKTAMPSFRCKLSVYVSAPGGGVGESIATVEFYYLMTNITTNAGLLSVLTVANKGSFIKGLYFISGKTGSTGMRIAIVCGLLGAVVAPHLAVAIDMEALTFTTNSVPMAQFAQLAFVSTAATANDVTDAISLLAVADTVV